MHGFQRCGAWARANVCSTEPECGERAHRGGECPGFTFKSSQEAMMVCRHWLPWIPLFEFFQGINRGFFVLFFLCLLLLAPRGLPLFYDSGARLHSVALHRVVL